MVQLFDRSIEHQNNSIDQPDNQEARLWRELKASCLCAQILGTNQCFLFHVPESEGLVVSNRSDNWLGWVDGHCNLFLRRLHV